MLARPDPVFYRIERPKEPLMNQDWVKTVRRSKIVNDPNWAEDPEHTVRLVREVIGVSLETVEITAGPPELGVKEGAEETLGVL